MNQRIKITGLSGSFLGYFIAQKAKDLVRPLIILCPRDEDAEKTRNDTSFFLSLMGKANTLQPTFYPSRPSDLHPSHLVEPHIFWERMTTLAHLLGQPERTVVFLSFQALAQYTLPKSVFLKQLDLLEPGLELDRDLYATKLIRGGYERDHLVEEPGTFAVRGGVIDIFSPQLLQPVRIELAGDVIESIRSFDPTSQRSLDPLQDVTILPCRETLFESEGLKEVKSRLKEFADSKDLPRSTRLPIEEALEDGRYISQMDPLLPIFYKELGTFFDYVPANADVWFVDPFSLQREREQLLQEMKRVEASSELATSLCYSPADLSLPFNSLDALLNTRVTHELSDIAIESETPTETYQVQLLDELRHEILAKVKRESPLEPLVQAMNEWRSHATRVIFVASSETEAARIQHLLENSLGKIPIENPASPKVLLRSIERPIITTGLVSCGFYHAKEGLVVLSEHELFRSRKHAISRSIDREDFFASISELSPGDAVVHLDFGVGIYRGLERITAGGVPNDFLHLEYAGGDKLYLPIYRLNRIQKYVGSDSSSPKVDRLGNASIWQKTRERAEKAIQEMAQELIALYAARQIAKSPPLSRPDPGYLSFETEFPYEETRDQLKTLEEVSKDLESAKPMDRLVCGDVGFGKTEIALRAAFRVLSEGKQVAILVPTTVLATQHYETFKNRLKNYPFSVDFLSRFKTSTEQKKVLADLKDGRLDLVVGTHRLLSKDVQFRELGLLVIDEEHRFGVKHKERIKQFRNNVHVLTLTATPIPRTLQMSVAGIRDLSVINTPPLDRKAIQTFLCRFEDSVIQGAIRKELNREGQVFFVHNRVETIHGMASYLHKLVPEARIGIGHGQMQEDELEEVMLKFIHREYDILLCTTIIESGLDISRANTILINRADQFGLAQLYQLRGRVGRSERDAFAYLLIPGEELISRDALKRLKVLKRFTELGSGLKIALHDLEIRGAGNLLGASQSGHIAAVGLELYTQLLEREVRKMKGEEVKEEIEPEIHCNFPAFLPDDYVASTGERLLLYKRLSSAKTKEELDSLKLETKDRFGELPPTVENLFEVMEIKILARDIGVATLRLSGERPVMEFTDQSNVNIDRVIRLVQKDKRLKLTPNNRMLIELGDGADTLDEVRILLEKLK